MDPKINDCVAIDVAKDELCVLSGRKSFCCANDRRGLRKLLKHLRDLQAPWVFCEATGGYERKLVEMLHKERILVSLLNPGRVRNFARSEGMKAKNDPIDAQMIRRFALEKQLAPTPPAPRPELTALMDRRTHLSDELAREKTRLQNSSKSIHASIRRMIALFEKELARIEEAIRTEVRNDETAAKAAAIMQRTKGVGPVTAWAVLAYLPEITQLSRNRVVAMAGLAPYDRDSGKYKGTRRISGGRQKVRDKLYMAAVTAAQHNPIIAEYVERAKARGKENKWAHTAAMRKLLIHLQSTLKKHELSLA